LIGIVDIAISKLIDTDQQNQILGIILYLSSVIPFSISNIYKEIKLKGLSLGPIYVNTQISIWQLIFTILFLPIVTIPGFGSVKITELPQNTYDGILCIFFGQNSSPTDECTDAWIVLITYTFINILFNLLYLSVIRYASSSLTVVSTTVAMPIATICFSQAWIMGNHATKLEYSSIIALIVVLLGYLCYNIKKDHESTEHVKFRQMMDDDDSESLLGDGELTPRSDNSIDSNGSIGRSNFTQDIYLKPQIMYVKIPEQSDISNDESSNVKQTSEPELSGFV
jgi:hypothetical protein